jgi:glycine/D-amino acid oxidase-like deaminating enzyme
LQASSRRRTASIVACLTVPYWLDSEAPTYPPLTGDEQVDVVVVGGGVTGLSCARLLAENGARVRVLEARRAATGASGRNGGFALRGLSVPYARNRLTDLWRFTEESVERMAEIAGDALRRAGSLYVVASEEEAAGAKVERDALVEDGFVAEWVDGADLPPLLRTRYVGGIYNPADGALHPGRWARRMASLATQAGASISDETRALEVSDTSVTTERGTVSADHVVVATDGYTHRLLPELDEVITPARAQMLATEPLADHHFANVVAAREGWDYWQQTADGRLLMGGQRDLELDNEYTRDDEPSDSIQSRIETFARTLVPDLPRITHRWAGSMGFTPDWMPLVGALPGRPGVWVSLGYSGHGNVLALACGEAVAKAILGRPEPRLAPLSPERILGARVPA